MHVIWLCQKDDLHELREHAWKRLEQWIYEKCNILFDFNHIEILFGKINRKFNAVNLIILLVKQYI